MIIAGRPLGDELFEAIAGLDGHSAAADEIPADTAPYRLASVDGQSVSLVDGSSAIIGRLEHTRFDATRGSVATLVVNHPYVSRRHAEVMYADGRLTLADLGSRNGTIVVRDGSSFRVGGAFPLQPGDRVATSGDTTLFVVEAQR